ncbi:formimidoylglutamate deiminase [Consotaella salsifontis]|uniref:Formimidoylglutamate deiminase n=1 Tax=Consotaella salsifontis TaxID=1365950 RepID=A0A1T4SNT0_9HYPH|nr:formimidoylglutamate deiminase [Consotaella salsifontis]SKA29833.1 formimidoylglutamate deiminase [Consotaella salsifontis]
MSTLWFDQALLPSGWARNVAIEIDGGRIVAVEADRERTGCDEAHAIGVPGLPNVHSHAFQRAMAGLTEVRGASQDSFWTWRQQMYRTVDAMTPDDVEAVAALAYVEMLESGFTRVGEFHYLHHAEDGSRYSNVGEMSARIAAAAETTGIGLTMLPVFYAHANFGGAEPSPSQRRFISSIETYGEIVETARAEVSRLPGAVVGIAPHSLRAATFREIEDILPLAGGGPVHIHVAEQTREVEECLAIEGGRPVELLLARAPVDERWCLIHATHVTDEEVRGIVAAGATVGLCPITEANLGDGIFPAAEFAAAGGHFAVGSDSNVEISAPGELRMLEYSQRLSRRVRNAMAAGSGRSTGRSLFEAALSGGSRALGVEGRGLAVGAPADIVSLDPARAIGAGLDQDAVFDTWIFTGASSLVDCVWRHGIKQVEGGRHRAREVIAARLRASLKRMMI